MQAQQAIALPTRSYSTVIAILATVVAGFLAVALVFSVERPAVSSAPTVVTLHGIGSEQIAHNRSEEGLVSSASVGGQQIAHNRSEEGFSNP